MKKLRWAVRVAMSTATQRRFDDLFAGRPQAVLFVLNWRARSHAKLYGDSLARAIAVVECLFGAAGDHHNLNCCRRQPRLF
jgi:hypothetical protein